MRPTPPGGIMDVVAEPLSKNARWQGEEGGSYCVLYVLPANTCFFRVEPRGFEPLTSAVQSQIHNVVVVCCCSEMPAKSGSCLRKRSCLFAVVRVGWCTTGVLAPPHQARGKRH